MQREKKQIKRNKKGQKKEGELRIESYQKEGEQGEQEERGGKERKEEERGRHAGRV